MSYRSSPPSRSGACPTLACATLALVSLGTIGCAAGVPGANALPLEAAPTTPRVGHVDEAGTAQVVENSIDEQVAGDGDALLGGLPKGSKVLVVGDSFAGSLGVGLKRALTPHGVRVVLRGKQSTFVPDWAGPTMQLHSEVQFHKPDLVVIALGGNELGLKNPEIRKGGIQKIVALADGRPCVWVAPALWKLGDPNQMLDVLRAHSKPCRYFDSNKLAPPLPRGADEIHPDEEGQNLWASAFLSWLSAQRDPGAAPEQVRLLPRPEGE